MKRLSVVVMLAIVASILFSSYAVAGYMPANQTKTCDALLKAVNQLPPGSPALGKILKQASSFNCDIVMDRGALLALYYSTGGVNWSNHANWLTNPDHCTWFGVGCSGGRVTSIFLWQNNLIGFIPTELGYLSKLTNLELVKNQLSGAIPLELGNLSNLTDLNLAFNQLGSAIPPELGNLSNLTTLFLGWNQLSGPIPPELANLSNLLYLELDSNQLSGPIPIELSKLTRLHILSLSWNQISGVIPPELGNLSNLTGLSLQYNQLSGTIPPALGNFSNLINLFLDGNQLSGQVPSTFLNYSKEISGHAMTIYLFGIGNSNLCVPIDVYNALLTQSTDFLEQNICTP